MTPQPDLEAENERLRLQLAACGVVAMANTPETAAKARDMHPDYKSASCDDVARAVDREMALRAELATARKEADALRALLKMEAMRDYQEEVQAWRERAEAAERRSAIYQEYLDSDGLRMANDAVERYLHASSRGAINET